MYLWHFPLFLWLDHDRTGLSGTRLLAVRVGVTVGVATASFFLVERPIRHGLVLRGARAVARDGGGARRDHRGGRRDLARRGAARKGAAPPSPPFHDPVRALMLGDSTMLTLAVAIAPWTHLYDVDENASSTILGCGVTTSDAQFEHGVAIPTNWPCRREPFGHETMQQIWGRAVQSVHPEVVSILAGRWEVHNLLVDGHVVNITSPPSGEVAAGLTKAVRIAGADGANVVLMTQPCASSGERPNGQPWPEDSPSRIATYNGIVRDALGRQGQRCSTCSRWCAPAGTTSASSTA